MIRNASLPPNDKRGLSFDPAPISQFKFLLRRRSAKTQGLTPGFVAYSK